MTSLESELHGLDTEYMEDEAVGYESSDLSSQDYAERAANIMAQAFQKTGLVEIAQVKAAVGQVHLLGRVKDEKSFVDNAVFPVLEAVDDDECDSYFGIQYFLKKGAVSGTRRRRYGWVISFSSPDMDKTLREVCDVLDGLYQQNELMEVPLVGKAPPQSGGATSGRKGASPVGA
jgi:hypothetical protein